MGTVAGWTIHSIARSCRTAGQTTHQESIVPHAYTNQTTAGYTVPGTHKVTPMQVIVGIYNAPLSLLPLVTFASSSFALCRVVADMTFTLTSSLPLVTQGIHDSPVPSDTTSMSAPLRWLTLYPYLLTASWKLPCGLPSKPLRCHNSH